MTNSTLFLIGGTGGLGSLVAKGLATADGFTEKKALVRDLSKGKALQDMGWALVKVSDFKDVSEITTALAGAKVIVSTLSGGDMVGLETAAITAGKAAGASLFVPSQFGVDYRKWGTSFPFLAGKKQVLDFAEKEGMPTLKVFTGYFADWIFSFFGDIEKGTITIVGDGDVPMTFTHRGDIGFALAKALSDPKYAEGGCFAMEGDSKTMKQSVALLEKITGKTFVVETIDPLEALSKEQELLKLGLEGDMGAFFGSFRLHLLGEPARGNEGCNLSSEAESYGVQLKTLEETFKETYSSN